MTTRSLLNANVLLWLCVLMIVSLVWQSAPAGKLDSFERDATGDRDSSDSGRDDNDDDDSDDDDWDDDDPVMGSGTHPLFETMGRGGQLSWALALGSPATYEGEPLEPTMIKTGEVDEAHEGLLAQIVGEITGWGESALFLNDGSGEAKIYIKEATGIERPWVEKGEVYSVVGIVSQYKDEHELLPRYQSDIALWPGMLPVTGGESPSS